MNWLLRETAGGLGYVNQHEKGKSDISPRVLFSAGFTNYMRSPAGDIFNPDHYSVNQDMKQPLCNYFIASSHNTYLMGDQLMSQSRVDMYAWVLQAGCRCVEGQHVCSLSTLTIGSLLLFCNFFFFFFTFHHEWGVLINVNLNHSGLLGWPRRRADGSPWIHTDLQDSVQRRHWDHQQVRLHQEWVRLYTLARARVRTHLNPQRFAFDRKCLHDCSV